jgi:aspartyl protease family protein
LVAWLAILALIGAAITLFVSHDAGSIAGLSNDAFARLVAGLCLAIFLGGALTSSYRGRIFLAIKHFTGWVAVMLVLVALYAYRGELAVVADRVIGELTPAGSQINVVRNYGSSQAVRVKRGWSGHFVVRAEIRDTPIEMIVDTGASTVVLRYADAERLGLDMSKLRYTVPVQTANGSSKAARIFLPQISIGSVVIREVEALIARPKTLHQSLLGMSFLSRLRSYEFAGEYLELRG